MSNPLHQMLTGARRPVAALIGAMIDGVDPSEADAKGYTPLYRAVTAPFPAAVIALVRGGADVNAPCGPGGRTPLHYAIRGGMFALDTVEVLLTLGADANQLDAKGVSPLEEAFRRKGPLEEGLIVALIEFGANPDNPDGSPRDATPKARNASRYVVDSIQRARAFRVRKAMEAAVPAGKAARPGRL